VKTWRALAALAVAIALSGCFITAQQPSRQSTPPVSITPPQAPESVPDAVPRVEHRAQNGNPPFYDVFGKRYFVLSSSVGYVERGVASWYGPGFHKVRTSIGEPYDMYGMTAAHKTLPLPAYVRVTNLQNGRSVVVRVNDRGPFVGNRIIDLSYTAAAKLDMLRNGTAMVEVRSVGPTSPPGVVPPLPSTAPVAPSAQPLTAAAAGTQVNAAPWVSGMTPLAATAGGTAAAPPATAAANTAPAVPGAEPAPIAKPTVPPGAPAVLPAPVTSAPVGALFVQAGAFADPANAESLAQKLRSGGYGKVFVRDDVIGGRRMYRVRIGPVPGVPDFDRIVAALEQAGVRDAHLALD
jgi:rare lipoprotein A